MPPKFGGIFVATMRIFRPEVFQGSLKRKQYFEGWYFKQVSHDLKSVYSFIPGISLNKKDKHSFIQVINGINGKTHYLRYPLEEFEYDASKLWVRVGKSIFTRDHIQIDIEGEEFNARGKLHFTQTSPFPGSLTSPGIMGWYSFVPFMECYHGVVSANHLLEGELNINGEAIDFGGGKGYIEKDWGRSFPECWIWLQSNSFQEEDLSLFLSIAKIPWLKRFFIGFIAFVYHKGQFIRFATYNKSKIRKVTKNEKELLVILENKNYELHIDIEVQNAGDLLAPVRGKMDRMIKESIDSRVEFTLKDKKSGEILNGKSERAGLEIIEGIFDYL